MGALAHRVDAAGQVAARTGPIQLALVQPEPEPEHPQRGQHELFGCLQLGCGGQPCLGAAHQFAVHLAELAVAAQVGGGQSIHHGGRRFVGDEMACQLGGDEARRGRVLGQVVQHLAQGVGAFGVALAEQGFGAGFVPGRVEVPRVVGRLLAHPPAGEHGGERRHVGLSIVPARAVLNAALRAAAAGGAQGVQLQHLTRQVLVQAHRARAVLHGF